MPPGKAASQAGHAFLDAFLRAPAALQSQYQSDGHGTKVVLAAPNADELYRLYQQAMDANLPCALIVDSGHVLPPHFNGQEIVTALGLGPVTRDDVQPITGALKCL